LLSFAGDEDTICVAKQSGHSSSNVGLPSADLRMSADARAKR
jgi:hypothetical protein